MTTKALQLVVAAVALAIDGIRYDRGTVLGEVKTPGQDGVPPVVESTTDGVTRGHLDARIQTKFCVCLTQDELDQLIGTAEPDPDGSGGNDSGGVVAPYTAKGITQPMLLAEVNRRREAGRNVTIASEKKKDLIKALEADDAQKDDEDEADRLQDEKDKADPPADPAADPQGPPAK